MNLIIFLPIPFMNIPGSFGTIFLAMGLIERDGALMAAGYAIVALHFIMLLALRYFFKPTAPVQSRL